MNQPTKSAPVLTVDEARAAVIAAISATCETDSLPLSEALGRVTCNKIQAVVSIPPFRNSAMDGYAIRFADYQPDTALTVVGKSLAGHPFNGKIPASATVTITTGAQVPEDADTIVIVENTTITDNQVRINEPPVKHQHIRNIGDDIKHGATVVEANTRLTAAQLGLLAAQGMQSIEVFKQPRVGVFSTGDELCEAGQKRFEGAIYDSNRMSLCTMLRAAGYIADDLGIARDDQSEMQSLLTDNQGKYDFLLSSGGVSVGEADYVKSALEENGALQFWKVAMKPGKPMVTGKLKSGTYYFGLPGNPVSSMVTCAQFVIPALQTFEGSAFRPTPVLKAICDTQLCKDAGRFEFQRGIYRTDGKGGLQVTTTGLQDSHVLHSMGQANCFICLDAQSTGASAGDVVNIMLFDTLAGLTI